MDERSGDESRRGCATLGVALLLALGAVQAVPVAATLLARGGLRDPDEPQVGPDGTLFLLPFLVITGIALLVAASPRGTAVRPLRLAAGLVGAALVAEAIAIALLA